MNKAPIAIARDIFKETEEFKQLSRGTTQGIYLENRLIEAFIAGWEARENNLANMISCFNANLNGFSRYLIEIYETLDWVLKDMKCKYRWEKNIPEDMEDCEVDYSPELTKAIELHQQLKSILEG